MGKYLTLAGIVTATLLGACASTPPAARGQQVAVRMCNNCHTVAPDRPATSEEAGPSFMAMAARPGNDRAGLGRFLSELHGLDKLDLPDIPMPTDMLTPAERDDVIAYILSLRSN